MGLGYVNPHVASSSPFLDKEIYATLPTACKQSHWSESVVDFLTSQLGKASSIRLTAWQELALSVVRQALRDAAQGEYEALCWLITEGRDWLIALGVSEWIVDAWGLEL